MTDSIQNKKKREKDARQMLPTGDTGDKWQCVRAAAGGGLGGGGAGKKPGEDEGDKVGGVWRRGQDWQTGQ